MNELRIEGQPFTLVGTSPKGDLEEIRYLPGAG
jgi:hypothetical protein